jgi:hypothetical protein
MRQQPHEEIIEADAFVAALHADVHVEAIDFPASCEPLVAVDQIIVALGGIDVGIRVTRKRMRPGAGKPNSDFFALRHQKVHCRAEIVLHLICIPADAGDELDHIHIEFGLDPGIRLEGLQQILRPRGEGTGLRIDNLQFKLRPKRQYPVGAEVRVHFIILAGLNPSWPRTVSAILGRMDLSAL